MGEPKLLSLVLLQVVNLVLFALNMQGRNTSKGQWVTKYGLETRWHEAFPWEPVLDGAKKVMCQYQLTVQPAVFNGNADKATVIATMLPAVVFCRYVRIKPLEWQDSISLRLELYAHPIGAAFGMMSGSLPDAQITC
jgi:hypothetical protein